MWLGGGAGCNYSYDYNPGAGGGTNGINGSKYNGTHWVGYGGTQTETGKYTEDNTGGWTSYKGNSLEPKFGYGGCAYGTHGGSSWDMSGGGGGWYGGFSGGASVGGGGSGYIYTSSTASNYPSGCLLNSSYYLINAETIAGNQSFPNVVGNGNETGHSGNGAAKITPVN